MTLAEAKAARRENRRRMKTATGEALRLREELEAIYAVLIFKLARSTTTNHHGAARFRANGSGHP
jgi:hypothetical protein